MHHPLSLITEHKTHRTVQWERRLIMKSFSHYRIRKGSFLDITLPIFVMMAVIILTGLGNHFIDGM